MQRRRQLGAAVIIPWGSNVTRPDTQTVLLEGGDPLRGAEQQAVSFLTPPRGGAFSMRYQLTWAVLEAPEETTVLEAV